MAMDPTDARNSISVYLRRPTPDPSGKRLPPTTPVQDHFFLFHSFRVGHLPRASVSQQKPQGNRQRKGSAMVSWPKTGPSARGGWPTLPQADSVRERAAVRGSIISIIDSGVKTISASRDLPEPLPTRLRRRMTYTLPMLTTKSRFLRTKHDAKMAESCVKVASLRNTTTSEKRSHSFHNFSNRNTPPTEYIRNVLPYSSSL